MVRKNTVGTPPMKSAPESTQIDEMAERQLALDFDGRGAAKKKARAKVPRVRKAPADIDIPPKPEE